MQAVGLAFLIVPGLLLVGLLTLYITRAAATGQLPRNGLVGIRTRATQRDDDAWQAGHTAATPAVRTITAVCFVASALVIAAAAATQEPAAVGVTGLAAFAAVVVLMFRAARVAGRAADATDPERSR